jgi:adenosylhomocysteine nucleosidase
MTKRFDQLCVVTAADIEFKTVAQLLREKQTVNEADLIYCRGRRGKRSIALLQAAIGAAGFAEKLAQHLATQRYDALLVLGLAGALDSQLKTGDVVVYERCLDLREHSGVREMQLSRDEFASIGCDAALSQQLFDRLSGRGLRCLPGLGAMAARVVIDAQDKLRLGAQTGAQAVDMETFLLAETAARCGLACAAVRVVLDEATHDLPDFNAGLNAEGRLELGRTLQAMAMRPVASWHFLRSLPVASRALRQAAEAVLDQ